jgi:hypothetical protein
MDKAPFGDVMAAKTYAVSAALLLQSSPNSGNTFSLLCFSRILLGKVGR